VYWNVTDVFKLSDVIGTTSAMYVQRNTWGAFMQPLLWWKSNEYYILWVCVCSLRYPACNAHAPFCLLWPAPLCRLFFFSTLSHKRHDFRKKKNKLLNTKCVFWFSLQILSETFLILRRNERDEIENVYRSSWKVLFILFKL